MPPSPAYDSSGIAHHTIPSFKFLSGSTVANINVAYRSLNPSSTKGTILIPTCFSGLINGTLSFSNGSDSSGGNALSEYNVIIAAMLGNGESASPSTHASFPAPGALHYEDVIRAHHDLLTRGLGIQQLEAVVGFSMAGQQAYHWSVMYPAFVRRAVVICSSARTSAHNYAFLEGPIAALENADDYRAWKKAKADIAAGVAGDAGQQLKADSVGYGEDTNGVMPVRGVKAFGRAYSAWLTSAEWFRAGLWRTADVQSVEDWIAKMEKDEHMWNADDLLVLARMWQMGDIGSTFRGRVSTLGGLGGVTDGDEDLRAALRSIQCPVLLMPCRTDQYFRPEDNEEEVKFLKKGKLVVIESVWGHIAGGGANEDDTRFMDRTIAEFIAGT